MGWKFIELELVEAELSERLVEVRYLVVFGGVDHDQGIAARVTQLTEKLSRLLVGQVDDEAFLLDLLENGEHYYEADPDEDHAFQQVIGRVLNHRRVLTFQEAAQIELETIEQ